MSDWIALSDRNDQDPCAITALERGLFVLEYRLPLLEPTLLLQVQGDPALNRSFALFFDPASGVSLLHRQGDILRRHRLPGPIAQSRGTARLSFAFDLIAESWTLTHEVLGESLRQSAQGRWVLPLTIADMRALCSADEASTRHASVLWFGLTQSATLPDRAAWIGLNTPIDTKRGPIRAGLLRPGDQIATMEDGFQPLLRLTRHRFPSRGSFAPVVLRSPFFGHTSDILVSSDQLVMISGASVEYLFGVEEALISAASLCDGRVAVKDERRAVTDAVSLDLGAPVAITADGCCMMSGFGALDALPRRALLDYEALPLLTLLGRTSLRHVA